MTFAYPFMLLLLPIALLLLRRRRFNAIEISSLNGWRDAAEPRRVRRLKLMNILRAAACALLIIAMAGPQTERPVNEEVRQGIAIEMLLDISSSMDRNIKGSGGEQTTRMEAAKKAVEAFIGNRPDDLIGLITFARYADTLSPLTFGHEALIQLVQDVEIQDRPNEDGTAYGDALSLACAHLDRMNEWNDEEQQPIQSKTIILLTDGENNCGLHLPQEAAGLAKNWGIRIYAISLGDADEKDLTDAEQLLEIISDGTGGGFWKIYDIDELSETYARIDELETSAIKSATLVHTEHTPVFTFFALPALLLLLTERIFNATALRITEEDEA
ncbi:vWA domain-containing protein [Tichowtungia aerotolerans]|uniref:VWA domain-containing protein n=1 Tax=Tichowtungia aerotolerans TaxID=2697043 RepID=A0A6P1M940_9BACT|nr:VWA domain-containing protein [Tichowtungia aerotolerans]QHI68608.1 VWA domain-containing protein [Tichowtungia aerotolerans]